MRSLVQIQLWHLPECNTGVYTCISRATQEYGETVIMNGSNPFVVGSNPTTPANGCSHVVCLSALKAVMVERPCGFESYSIRNFV